MTTEDENRLEELASNIDEAVRAYNLAAKEMGDFSRAAYMFEDLNKLVEDLRSSGEEIDSDWEPDYDFIGGNSPFAPEGEGWFPSEYC